MNVSRFNHAFYLSGLNHIRISNIVFRHYGQGPYAKAVYIDTSNSVVVEKCVFAYNDIGVALKRESHRNVIQDNEFKDTIFDWPWSAVKTTGGIEDGGVVFYDPCTGRGNVIRRNVFHDDFDGFGTCPGTTGAEPTNETDVYENVVYNMGDDGVSTDGRCSNVRLWNNTFYNVLVGVSMAPVYDGPVYAIRNLIHRTGVGNNSYPGSSFKFNSGYSASGPMYLFHNTSDAYYTENSGIQIKLPGSWAKIYARNNIWSGTDFAIYNVNTTQPVDLNYDGLYTTLANELVYWDGVPDHHMRDLATFQQSTGQELNGLSCQPRFSDPASHDYSLASGSCLIDKGLVIPGINDGFSGTAPDIGAFEHVTALGLEQALMILKVQAGMQLNGVDLTCDVNNDGKLGISDVIYILQKVAGLR
jgi:Right handed beta helix region